MDKLREALERIADPMNTHFAGDAQVVAREALAAALAAPSAEPVALTLEGLPTYEPTVVIAERRELLDIAGAAMEAKDGGRWVRLTDVLARLVSPPAVQAAAGEMPPLPEPLTYIAQFHGEWRETVSVGGPVFTAAQVRDYARSCMATTPAQSPAAQEVSERVGFPDRITLAQPPAAPLSEDLQQIIYAIERSARTLERQADELHAQRDYSAGLPAADAESLRKAVALLKGCRFGAEG